MNTKKTPARRTRYARPTVTLLGDAVKLTNGGQYNDTHDSRQYYY
ncbi:hypothetical protein [Stackebrandtia nassauensis]|uniref:Lasso RiPP family leader peptide-containing protein n=1 Tax=Stackebrandtia nassauensis (strain DSM 44728 / CIP 108903 / NRRL B-16338 / NBRC 102104 / LLR-40K-21) TaxID=446470 RepID=D3Q2G0_STANL|nr:hypothetical protein [Stackebrandtia nassauensis]ADD43893.1 hypothetical protein Snas_4244 [Stackebrandtia nassauensis DSM 44728]